MDYSAFMNMNMTLRKYRAKNLISDAISRDSQDYSTANEWVSGRVEMNSAHQSSWHLHESMLILLYNKLNK